MTRLHQRIDRPHERPHIAGKVLGYLAMAVIGWAVLQWAFPRPARGDTLNELRAAHGLKHLRHDTTLSGVAYAKARALAAGSSGRCTYASLNHDGFRGSGAMAENVSCGSKNATAAIQQWMRSSGHRRNILLRSAGSYGLGSARTSTGTVYWAMELGP